MVKMVKLARTKAEGEADKEAMGEPMGRDTDSKGEPEVHLDHHHMRKMGWDEEEPPVGHEVEMRGHVVETHSTEREGGDGMRSMRVRITHATKGGDEVKEGERSKGLRDELVKNTKADDEKRGAKEKAKAPKESEGAY